MTCRVIAQAADFQPVAEEDVAVEASTATVVDKPVTLVTLRRAATAGREGLHDRLRRSSGPLR